MAKFNWKKFGIIFIQIALAIVFLLFVHVNNIINDTESILEILITINGISSAILTTFLFGRLNIVKESKKDAHNKAVELSQIIVDLQRIMHELTNYYGIWRNDRATKNLLDVNDFKSIEYFDYKLMSYSDYEPEDKEFIDRFEKHEDYQQVDSDLYLSMISIANDRKSHTPFNSILHNDYFDGIYVCNTSTIEKMLEVNHLSRLSDNLRRYGGIINYRTLTRESKERIAKLITRINPNYQINNNELEILSKILNDIEVDILPKLLRAKYIIDEDLTQIEIKIISIIRVSLITGVLLPLINLGIDYYYGWQIFISELLIVANLIILLYFIFKLKDFSIEQLK